MSFKYTTNDRPDYIDDLEEAAHLFETGKEEQEQVQEENLDQVQSKAHDELATNSNIRKNK